MTLNFTPEAKAKLQEIVGRYPNRQAALLPTLWLAQEQFSCLNREVLTLVANELDLPLTQVVNTCSFYTMYYPYKRGKYHIELCVNVACWLRGCDKLAAVAKDELGLSHRQTSDDQLFTYEEVECLAACDKAPMCQVNGEDTYNLTPESFRELLRSLRQRRGDDG